MDSSNIIKIQREYINIIESLFQKEISDVKQFKSREEIDKYVIKVSSSSLWVGSYHRKVTIFEDKFIKLISALQEHWNKYENEIMFYCTQSGPSKVIIWPDVEYVQLAPKLLLYYDTILIPDPINLSLNVIKSHNYRDLLIYFAELDELKKFITDDLDKPLIIFFNYKKSSGSKFLEKESNMAFENLTSQGGELAINAFNKLFGNYYEFNDFKTLMSDLNRVSIKELNKYLKKDTLKYFLQTFINDPEYLQASYSQGTFDFVTSKRLEKSIMTPLDFINIFSLLNSLFSVHEAREFNSKSLGSVNLITNTFIPFSEFKYQRIIKDYGTALEIAEENFINYSLSQKFDWVDHIDIEKCIEIREKGVYEKIRKILEQNARKIKLSSFEDFPKLSRYYENEVKQQIQEEIALNEKKIKILKSQRSKSLVSFGITAGLTFGSLAYPAILPLTILSAGYGIIAGANARDLVNEILAGKSKLRELGNRSLSIVINKYQPK
jgi:hypothetical protein